MRKNQKWQYEVKNPEKYRGDPTDVVARSKWELMVFDFLDRSKSVKAWSSEELIIAYRCKTDNRIHRYFVDLKIWLENRIVVVEIKPNYQIKMPVRKPNQRESSYLWECMTYVKNQSKWDEAKRYCARRGWTFQIWDENVLTKLGIQGVVPLKRIPLKRSK